MRANSRCGRGVRLGAAVLAATVLPGACGSEGGDGATEAPAVIGAWARPTPGGADEGVAYLRLAVDRDDAVVGASVSPEVAGEVQLHQTTGGSGGPDHDHGAEASVDEPVSMGEVAELPVTAEEPLVFEPGGNHVMLVELVGPLIAGDEFQLELELASGRTVEASVPVQVNPPS